MIASSGMPAADINATKLVETRPMAGASTCSTARSRMASWRGIISMAPWRKPPTARPRASVRASAVPVMSFWIPSAVINPTPSR